jgi:hypothetical protein
VHAGRDVSQRLATTQPQAHGAVAGQVTLGTGSAAGKFVQQYVAREMCRRVHCQQQQQVCTRQAVQASDSWLIDCTV